MEPYIDRLPDARLMARLAIQVRFGDRIGAFMAGGDALALAALASAGGQSLPGWAHDLADAMVGALLLVEDHTIDDASAHDRLRLSSAALVLSVLRPRAACATDGAISLWMNWGMGTPRCADDAQDLLRWTLLRLFVGDLDGAVEAVHELVDREPSGAGMALYDWVVARVQSHGQARERECFGHLRTLLAADGSLDPALLVVAATVLNQAGPMRRDKVLPWLDGQADGHARRSAHIQDERQDIARVG
jgi:hypothetical protein